MFCFCGPRASVLNDLEEAPSFIRCAGGKRSYCAYRRMDPVRSLPADRLPNKKREGYRRHESQSTPAPFNWRIPASRKPWHAYRRSMAHRPRRSNWSSRNRPSRGTATKSMRQSRKLRAPGVRLAILRFRNRLLVFKISVASGCRGCRGCRSRGAIRVRIWNVFSEPGTNGSFTGGKPGLRLQLRFRRW